MLWLTASLPDALVGVAPDAGGALCLRLDNRPEPARQALVAPGVQKDRVEDCAEDIILALTEGSIAHPNRTGTRITRQVVPCRFGQLATAVNAVHDLQRAVFGRLNV